MLIFLRHDVFHIWLFRAHASHGKVTSVPCALH